MRTSSGLLWVLSALPILVGHLACAPLPDDAAGEDNDAMETDVRVAQAAGPVSGGAFRGRILLSNDGNYNDEDDWGALPVAIAILDAMGFQGKLVHVHYNNILTANTPVYAAEMRASALGAQQRYGLPRAIFFDAQDPAERQAAILSIRNEINRSTASDPLYIVLAGPMDLVYQGIAQSDVARRQHVFCISHNSWNDGYGGGAIAAHTKRDVIPTGVRWVQIRDGNPRLAFPAQPHASSNAADWSRVAFLANAVDSRLRWIHSRLLVEKRVDISDATMTYFLVTGDEEADLTKLERLLVHRERPAPRYPRDRIRIEAENFVSLGNASVAFGNGQASQRLTVRGAAGTSGAIGTRFFEPYAAAGRYRLELRYFDGAGGSRYRLRRNGALLGSFTASAESNSFRSFTTVEATLAEGDELTVEVERQGAETGELDYLELAYLGPAVAPPGSARVARFHLVDADADRELGPLVDGATLKLGTLPTRNLNVRAETVPATVARVLFALDGNAAFRSESQPPYALAGDSGGDFYPWTPATGPHTLTATPFVGTTPGEPLTVRFTVSD